MHVYGTHVSSILCLSKPFFIAWSPSSCPVFSLIRIGLWEIIFVGCLLLWVACT